MAENDQNLDNILDIWDLSSLSLDDESLDDIEDIENVDSTASGTESSDAANDVTQAASAISQNVFLDSEDGGDGKKNDVSDTDDFWFYLRWFYISAFVILIWVLVVAASYVFNLYITESSKVRPDQKYVEYIQKIDNGYKKVKDMLWKANTHSAPTVWSEWEYSKVNEIINATDIDYIEKKNLLSKYVSNLVRSARTKLDYSESLKQDIVKQWFLPEELGNLLSENQAIDTIQRSLNALEVIKFSTATRVFSYMNSALYTISEMIKVSGANVENLWKLFTQIDSRWEKDISSYVYMCYLNPFEVSANCDNVWDLDLYYKLAKDDSINIKLFKNAMNAISQLLERQDSSLFSITFNGFNAQDKDIRFNIEVFTTQEDEKSLLQQWKKNPNIFILTNIINLLKQSSFIIWANINTKEVNVQTLTINQWNLSKKVNYSTMDFNVPIQKNTEREIFDYIDLDSMDKMISDRWLKEENVVNEFEQ